MWLMSLQKNKVNTMAPNAAANAENPIITVELEENNIKIYYTLVDYAYL